VGPSYGSSAKERYIRKGLLSEAPIAGVSILLLAEAASGAQLLQETGAVKI
jgi:hypothetical protein